MTHYLLSIVFERKKMRFQDESLIRVFYDEYREVSLTLTAPLRVRRRRHPLHLALLAAEPRGGRRVLLQRPAVRGRGRGRAGGRGGAAPQQLPGARLRGRSQRWILRRRAPRRHLDGDHRLGVNQMCILYSVSVTDDAINELFVYLYIM